MAYIKVDRDQFERTASAIDSYISSMKTKMNRANSEVTALSSSWEGSDFRQFKLQWEKVTNDASVYNQMRQSLESYAKYLRFAANKYKEAQTNAANRANDLPKW